jgi:DNA-binding CsgD family transcriptional regulator
LCKSPFCNEWARPQGYLDAFCAVMYRSGDRSAVLHLVRDERAGYVNAADIEKARSFAPHLVRAAKLGLQFEHLSRRRQEREKSLDRLEAAIILLDAAGHILFANEAAEKMLRKQDGLTAVNRVLHAHDAVADRALQEVVARVSARDAAARRSGDVVVPRADRRPLVLSVTPLSQRSGEGFAPRATAIVVANDPEQHTWSGIDTVAKSYGLTAGEGRLLKAIVEGEGIDAAANQLGISRDTAKTHLQRIFQKTLTSRQGELIRLVTNSLPPLSR